MKGLRPVSASALGTRNEIITWCTIMRHSQTISKCLSHTRAWRLGNSNHTVRTRGVGGEDRTRERELIVHETSLSCLAPRNSVERGHNWYVPRSRVTELMGILSFSHYERSSYISLGPTCFARIIVNGIVPCVPAC